MKIITKNQSSQSHTLWVPNQMMNSPKHDLSHVDSSQMFLKSGLYLDK